MQSDNKLAVLRQELDWLKLVINQSLVTYLLQDGHENDWMDIPLPNLSLSNSPYAEAVKKWNLDVYARLALALGMAPHLSPEILDIFFSKNQLIDRGFTEFGGLSNKDHKGFLPTGQTLCFIITVSRPEMHYRLMELLGKEHILYKERVLELTETEHNLPCLSGQLSLSKDWFSYFLTGEKQKTGYCASFPVQKITTALEWEDMVLDDLVIAQVNEITNWVRYGKTLMEDWGLAKKLKPGYNALFCGPAGTGKTLAATLIGKITGLEVYKIDLSTIVSKYVGETEKNLSLIFEMALHQNWILVFDEEDVLFGKRSEINSTTDSYANQQIASLSKKIDEYPGVVILVTNSRVDIDEVFLSKFQTIIHFIMPTVDERYKLWQNAFSGVCKLDESIDLYAIAVEYELTGGAIINILRYCALTAISRGGTTVTEKELLAAIGRETCA